MSERTELPASQNAGDTANRPLRLLICTDGSAHSDDVVQFGTRIATGAKADTTLVGIIEHPGHERAILDSLRGGRKELESREVGVEGVTKAGDPVQEIVKRTIETAYDLVVIGAVRKEGQPIALSAKAYKLIKRIPAPVLVVIGRRPGLRRILLCAGGRAYIRDAVTLTARIARATGARVTLFHVLYEPPPLYADLMARDNSERLLRSNSSLGRELRAEKAMLEDFAAPVDVQVRPGLGVVDEILREAAGGDYDLVVTGSTPPRGGLHSYVMGDVTRELLAQADRPLLVVRHEAARSSPRAGALRTWWRRLVPSSASKTPASGGPPIERRP